MSIIALIIYVINWLMDGLATGQKEKQEVFA